VTALRIMDVFRVLVTPARGFFRRCVLRRNDELGDGARTGYFAKTSISRSKPGSTLKSRVKTLPSLRAMAT